MWHYGFQSALFVKIYFSGRKQLFNKKAHDCKKKKVKSFDTNDNV
jgi:hypothetical protein